MDGAFESLFYGEGHFLGLLLFAMIILVMVKKFQWAGMAISFPLILLMFYEYYSRLGTTPVLVWNMLITLFLGITLMGLTLVQTRR